MSDSENQEVERPLCTHCTATLSGTENFCPHCGCPLTPQAASMPYESVLAEGFIWREGASRPRYLIVPIGIWLLFGPGFLVALMAFIVGWIASWGLAWQPNASKSVLTAILGQGVLGLAVAVLGALLYKTTRNYIRLRRAERVGADADDNALLAEEASEEPSGEPPAQ